MPHLPTSDLVALAWLKGIDGLSPDSISTTLPSDNSKLVDGFVVVSTVGGSPDIYVPMRNPVVAVDCYAAPVSGNKAPWARANALAEAIRMACYDRVDREVQITPGDYLPARVVSAYMVTEPRRINGDPAGFARYSADLQLHYTV